MEETSKPDPMWEIWAKDKAEYKKKFVHLGRFHSSVHEDVLKDYQTAEQLMIHAWNHYPMYDEAFKKLLGIVEMGVKLRYQQLGLVVRKGTGLVDLIDKLYSEEHDERLKLQLHRARERRNFFAHPERHTTFGYLLSPLFIPLINLVNRLFLDPVGAEQEDH